MSTISYQDMAERASRAKREFIALLADRGDINLSDAEVVFDRYKQARALNLKDQHVMGVITVRHGGFLDRDVIRRALVG